jgi:Dihaem cytochrome c
MPKRHRLARRLPARRPLVRRSPILLILLLVLMWCACLGIGLAQAIEPPGKLLPVNRPETAAVEVGTVDVIPDRYKPGHELYLQNCATCHIGIPPAVLPSETWKDLLQDEQHYGATLKPIVGLNRTLLWNYLKTFSRLRSPEEERTPYRVADSRYFRALHPAVNLPRKFSLESCVTCHPGAGQFNFRQLSAAAEK